MDSLIRRILNHWYILYLFDRFRWFRRLYGGHWERWWVDVPVASSIWHAQAHGTRYGLMYDREVCEDYPKGRGYAG